MFDHAETGSLLEFGSAKTHRALSLSTTPRLETNKSMSTTNRLCFNVIFTVMRIYYH